MRKTNNIFLMLLLAVIGGSLYSCSDELVKSDFDYNQDPSVGLATIQFDALEKESDEEVSLSATITSEGNSPIYDQGFIYSEDQSFTTYETISVTPDEEAPTKLEIVRSIEQGKSLYFKAYVLTKDGLVTSSDSKSINLPVTWETVGTVNLTDNTFSGETYAVELQKFSGRDEYRLVDPFDTGTSSVLRCFLDEDGNADSSMIPNGVQPTGTAYDFYWHANYVGQYCNFSNKANVYTLDFLLLQGESLYTGGNVVFEWDDGYPGEIPEPIEVTYSTDFSDDSAREGWVLDQYSGTSDTDNVCFFHMAEAGAASWGTSIAAVYEGTSYRIISPAISIDSSEEILSFGYYAGLFGSTDNAKVKVYVREVGSGLDLSNPVKEFDLPKGGSIANIELGEEYDGKTVKVIFIVEQGDFLFYRFAVSPSDDLDAIFR